MEEVYLTAREAAKALQLSYFTVVRYAGDGVKFPNAKLRDNSRRKGYRIPESDVLAYALAEGRDRLRRAHEVINEIKRTQDSVPAAS